MSHSTSRSKPLGAVVGSHLGSVRRARSLSQDDLARLLQSRGLDWTRDQIANLEAGRRRSVEVDELVILAVTLNEPLASFFEGEGQIELRSWKVDLGLFRALFPRGQSHELLDILTIAPTAQLPLTLEERSTAEKLGLTAERVRKLSLKLWGVSLTERRDQLLSERGIVDANERRAVRGHITRDLVSELRKSIKHPREARQQVQKQQVVELLDVLAESVEHARDDSEGKSA